MIQHVGVVGAGTMGIGVSQAFALGGCAVTLVDVAEQALAKAERAIATDLRMAGMFHTGPAPSAAEVGARITLTTKYESLRDVGFLVENVTESPLVKQRVYEEIDEICPAECVFGVNTSAIPITRIASHTSRPDRVIGTHFMNPAQLKPLVEVIRGFHTSESTITLTRNLLTAVGKQSVVVADSPGFVTNRVAMLCVNEAICLLDEGVATAAEIDRLFVGCLGHRMGPLATADLIGLDTVLHSLVVLLDNFDDPKFRPSILLRRYVDAGLLGRKSGRGFFTYDQSATSGTESDHD
ncbi:3-hydroxybutyryl-CoA dehydrogenase [Kibdelosporangium banguiense]|uniref:3-hydroxybutyryl-CoA dehydrogenase n=1 Tax=Kibdelosporangium banguiense TaxID=1365924 RepID=A0ABS4TVW6_9PSEU|nr:3-hydroxyacyl-CoA dehydrogenase family protein [Kibdelosporangium banguiense]MBP2328534.1 3-hydroxybutyryl-CoA dehydrogenase [Kibdelosporangium banguiense]